MFKKMCIVFMFFLAIGLVGCAHQVENTPTLTPIKIQEQIDPLPTLTIQIPTVSPTNTPAVSQMVMQECVQLAGLNLPPPVETENNFLLLEDGQASYPSFLLNPANGKITRISPDAFREVFVSPDGHRFSYVSEDKINIANAKGEIVASVLLDKKDVLFDNRRNLSFWGWLDDEHVMITPSRPERSPGTPLDERLPPLVILGVSDHSRIELKSVYPNIDWTNYLGWQFNRVIYDSSMNYAIYPSDGGHMLTLYSISEQKAVAYLPATTYLTQTPHWSPNEKYLAVAGKVTENKAQQELFLLDKNGNTTRVTHLTEQFDNVEIGTLTWSPDGQKIAFWYHLNDSIENRLAVVDLTTITVKDFCVTSSSFAGYPAGTTWSPDSLIVLVNVYESEHDMKSLWINTETDEGAIIEKNTTVRGWLVAEP